MADLTLAPSPRLALTPGSPAETLVDIAAALTIVGLSVASLILGTVFGAAVCFTLTLALCLKRPTAVPVLILTAFLFQNTFVALFTPLVVTDDGFDTLRAANFVVLMTAYAAFLAASLQRAPLPGARPWILGCILLLAVVTFYLILGAVVGEPRDAIVYFRNTIGPVACLHVALVAASRYRIEVTRALAWLGAVAVGFGYLELFFTLDFLSLFNGDLYIERQMARQIDTGYWEDLMQETGFVLRGLHDVMTTSFFNSPLFETVLPPVWRLAGPNFHPISYAYALTIIAVFLLFRGRWVLPLLTLPVLMVIGSKGAFALLVLAIAARVGVRLVGPRLVTLGVVAAASIWIGAAIVVGIRGGDFHTLGLLAGLRDFLGNPLGVGLGLGGNLSSSTMHIDWGQAQTVGATEIPMESAVGVLLYQMGIGAIVYLGFLAALAELCRRLFLRTGDQGFLFSFVSIVMIVANAVLQEEAIYSPLAIGFCLLLTGLTLGNHWRHQAQAARA